MSTIIATGDNVELLRRMPDASVDAVVCDPPYGLSKEPDAAEVLRHWLAGDDYTHRGGGFMGKSWDSFVPGPVTWREIWRVLKPGAHVLAFYGTRTYDLGVMAIRLAGFEIRDQLAWMYGTGFPKSLDVSKAIDAAHGRDTSEAYAAGQRGGIERGGPGYAAHEGAAWSGWGTALKPAQEPIVLARKPLIGTVAANVLAHGTGGLNVDACRIEGARPDTTRGAGGQHGATSPRGAQGRIVDDGAGRWPANVLLDEDASAMLDAQSGDRPGFAGGRLRRGATTGTSIGGNGSYGTGGVQDVEVRGYGDTGASRFFYVAKASKAERESGLAHLPLRSGGELTDRVDGSDGLNSPRAGAGRGGGRRNHHPTVKPIELMRYLVRLVTPPGGIVLDPWCGSGSTVIAAALEGFDAVGMDISEEYTTIARARVAHWSTKR